MRVKRLIIIGIVVLLSMILCLENCYAKSNDSLPVLFLQIGNNLKQAVDSTMPKPLGRYKITGYSYYDDGGQINYQTSTGAIPKPYTTCAVDPNVIPYGTRLYIPDFDLELIAEDCGGAIKGEHIDIHVGYDDPTKVIGNSFHEVYILGE